ncbi:hypothetical protein AGMMS50256_38580 [Betaproteobacteria bacterium]|nr:hypothetical protein AGMMS50256_38580 [Betaproteobacteria bacterium]
MNTLDFCYLLRVADDPPPVPASGSLNIDNRQVAYALRLPGDLPEPGGTDFTPPTNPQTWQNNARTRAVSLATLWQRLECGEATASIGHAHPNAATASVMLYRSLFDYEQVQQQAVELAEVGVLIATSQLVSSVAAIVDAVASALHAGADTAKIGNVTGVPAAILMAAAAALQVPLAIISMASAVETQQMAEQRFVFVKGLRASAHTLAQGILNNAIAADAQGLYRGQW